VGYPKGEIELSDGWKAERVLEGGRIFIRKWRHPNSITAGMILDRNRQASGHNKYLGSLSTKNLAA